MYLFYVHSINRRNGDGFRQLSECFVSETQEILAVSGVSKIKKKNLTVFNCHNASNWVWTWFSFFFPYEKSSPPLPPFTQQTDDSEIGSVAAEAASKIDDLIKHDNDDEEIEDVEDIDAIIGVAIVSISKSQQNSFAQHVFCICSSSSTPLAITTDRST